MLQRHRFIAAVLLLTGLIFLALAPVFAASVTVSAPAVEAQAGGTVDVPIQLAGAQGLGAVHLELVYDASVLTAETVTKGALAGNNALLESNLKQAGRVVIGVVTLDGISGDGAIATVRFKVNDAAGASSALNFENNQAWERASHAEVLVNSQAGQVTIAAGLPSWLIPAAIAFAALVLVLFLIFLIMRRRRPAPAVAPQPAYTQPTYAPPTLIRNAPPLSAAPRNKPSSMPLDLPERPAATTAKGTNPAEFKRVEDEFFKLKGQVAAGRITQAQFEEQLRGLIVQDAQGRHWMLGADSAKWYVHDGTDWVERNPFE